jgi:NAD(P)-dependent dehydrogenase (short-subunit alcohol dehydrogenase family)
VRANAICPGFIDTAMLERSGAQFAALAGVSFDEVATVGQGRLSKSEDVAALATFLASDGASFINGTAILVDGGMNLRRM